MERLKRLIEQLRGSLAGMSASARLASAALLVLAVAGGLWLALGQSKGMVAAFDRQPDHSELAAIRQRLVSMGIPHSVKSGRLVVPAESRQSVQQMLTELRGAGNDGMSALRKLASHDDIWQSQAAADRKWQVAKMDLLSRMITDLPQVQSADVVMDTRRVRKFGAPGGQVAAAVKVHLAEDLKMTPRLVGAIADIVAGSVAGMTRQDVRIVDSVGISYRAVDYDAAGIAEVLTQSEQYYEHRIRSALAFIEGLAVTVTVSPSKASKELAPCGRVDISVPREHIRVAMSASGIGDDRFIEGKLADIRRRVMAAAGIANPASVNVELHDGAPRVSSDAAAAAPPAQATSQWPGAAWAALAGCGLCLATVALVWWSLRSRRDLPKAKKFMPRPSESASCAEDTGAFDFLRDLPNAELVNLLAQEHPQTVALVLSQMGPGKAAAVLAGMMPERQVQIVRRIASLGAGDIGLVQEISAGLAEKLARGDSGGKNCGGVSAAAEILNHTGYEAGQAVMESLSGQEPSLADSLREQMFGFEDIVNLPPEWLREGLAKVGADEIAVALRTAGVEMQDRVLAALPAELANQVRQEMDAIGPVRLSDVEAAQHRLASYVHAAGGLSYVSDHADTDIKVAAFIEDH